MKTFTLTYNNRPLLKSGYTYYTSENLGPINTWTIPSTTTDVVSYSSEDTIKLNGKGGHYETCYKAFSVEKTGTYTISYDYNLPTVNFYGTDSNHMYFGIFITTNQPPGGDMGTWSAYSTGNCNGYVICGPSSQYNSPGEGHAQFNYNLTAGTTYYLWVPMMNLADGVLTYLTFTNLKWIDTEAITVPDYKAKTNIYDLEILSAEHGTCVANKYSGFTDSFVSVTATPDEGWYHIGYDITGSVMTGDSFKFLNNDVNLEPIFYETEGYPITYETTVGGSCTGDTDLYIPGSTGITLQTAYNTYYRLSGYEVTGGTIENNVLIPTGPCTARAVYKVNYFTARGKFNQVVRASENWGRNGTGQAYAYAYYTGGTNCPNSYYTATYTSYDRGTTNAKASGWNPTGNISGYSFTGASTSYAFIEDTTRFGGGIARLQVNNSNFGNGAWPNKKGNPTCTATGSTTTKGPVRYYLSGKCAKGYQVILSCLAKTGNNGWTATGIAP
jgi:hypothetical protein